MPSPLDSASRITSASLWTASTVPYPAPFSWSIVFSPTPRTREALLLRELVGVTPRLGDAGRLALLLEAHLLLGVDRLLAGLLLQVRDHVHREPGNCVSISGAAFATSCALRKPWA